jgi:hypothetical protein
MIKPLYGLGSGARGPGSAIAQVQASNATVVGLSVAFQDVRFW